MASLKILSGKLSGQTIELNIDPNFIGRNDGNEIRITDAGVSGKHAKIWAEDDAWFVMDLGSTNGTLVNNSDIDREQLRDGDKLAFGPIVAQFVGGAAARRPASPPGRAAPGPVASGAPAGGFGVGASGELELELNTLKARYSTLEKEIDRVRSEAAQNEKRIAELAVANMKEEMQKLRDLMRERDESMRTIEGQIKEREAYYSPEEMERERKRVEASVQLETRRQLEAHERQARELEARLVARSAELEATQRTLREKDDLLRLMSEREDRAGNVAREKEDKLGEVGSELKRLQDELAAATAREREASDKLRQKNMQLAEMGKQQADLTNEVARARAAAARVQAGDSSAGAEQASQMAAELDQARQQLLKARADLNVAQDEIIGARSGREQEAARSAALQAQLDEVQGQLTDLADAKARLEAQVNELLQKHAAMAENERQVAGLQAELAEVRVQAEAAVGRHRELDVEVSALRQERLDLIAAREAAEARLTELDADYRVLRSSRDATFDWEARYKSQMDEFDTMRRQNSELRQTVEALNSQVGTAQSGTVDDATLTFSRARTRQLEEMAAGMLDGINNSVSLLRRNSEVLKGYVHDCGLLANCVRQINYTLLEPDQQQMLRELIDETQPDVIIRNMEGIGEENAEATAKAKRLILDYQDAMKTDEEGTDLERCFAKSQGLVQAVDPGSQPRVKVASALPVLPVDQPGGVLFAYALLREAKAMAVDEESVPGIRLEVDGASITMMVSPVHQKAKERYRETAAGSGGDPRSQYILGFARQACNGRVDVKDMGDAATMFITLHGTK